MKILVIAGLHGDELFGLKILGKLQQAGNDNIATLVGHPEAVAKGKRYLETDLNRSFGADQQTLEGSIAHNLERKIKDYGADLIIDLHTSITKVGDVAIAARRSPALEDMAQKLGMDAFVIMPPHIARPSLIGRFPDKALSLEFGKGRRSDTLAETVASKISTLKSGPSQQGNALPIFEVQDHISKDFKGLSDIQNLVFNTELNGYPFLAGVNTYETIGGFITKKLQ